MASRKSVVFTKCSFSFTLRGTERGWRVLRTGTARGQRRSPERRTGRGLCPAQMQTDTPRPRGPSGGQWPPHAASLPSWQAAAPRREPHVLGEAVDAAGEVLRHRPALHGLDADLLQRLSEPADGDSGVTRGASDTGTSPAPPAPPRTPPGVLPAHPAHLIRSGLLSSLPRCSRPRVQAKMLAMGFVLVGRPCVESGLSCPARAPHAGTAPRAEPTHLLVLPVVAGDGAVGRLGLNGLPVRTHKDRGH